jgi:20S proteasome alpha/beta subunit
MLAATGSQPGGPRALKQRYPRAMTIAACFKCSDGVLIGADTRVEDAITKWEDHKLFHCSPDGADYHLVMSGCGGYYAIASLARDLKKHMAGSDGTLTSIDVALDWLRDTPRYLKSIDPEESGFVSDLLFAVSSADKRTELFHMSELNLIPVDSFKCIGSGESLARFYVHWLHSTSLPIKVFLPMAMQIFRAAKLHHAGADDTTQIVRLYNTEPTEPRKITFHSDENFLWGLHGLLGKVLYGCFDPKVSDLEQIIRIARFGECAQAMRNSVKRSDWSDAIMLKLIEESN